MKSAYHSVFNYLVRFAFWVRTPDTQEWTAFHCLSFLLLLNVVTLYAAVTRVWFPDEHRVPVFGLFAAFGGLVCFNYSLLRHNAVFQQPTAIRHQRARPTVAWAVGAYVLLSCLLGAYAMKYLHDLNLGLR